MGDYEEYVVVYLRILENFCINFENRFFKNFGFCWLFGLIFGSCLF